MEQFVVGSRVTILDSRSMDGLVTKGMAGCVVKVDEKSGFCVQLFITRIFEPCFWYAEAMLELNTTTQTLPCTPEFIEAALGGRRQLVSSQSLIRIGALRSWLIGRARALPGQGVYTAASQCSWNDLYTMYNDPSNAVLMRWLDVNDTRARRPQMLASDVELPAISVGIRRPRME